VRCLSTTLTLALLFASLAACKSARERCDAAVQPARGAWQAYVEALQQEHAKAAAAAAAAEKSLKEEWQPRLEARARKKADTLHEAGSSAWWRAFTAAQDAICADDEACAQVRGDLSAAALRRDEMQERLDAAQSALSALDTPAQQAPSVEDDFERKDLLAVALTASAEAQEACADVED
jgi:hypothetical protein